MMVLDLITVKEIIDGLENLSKPFPSNSELEGIMKSIRWHMTPDIPVNIRADAIRLEQRILQFAAEPLYMLALIER